MTQHTGRDVVWDVTIRIAMTEESFCIDDIAQNDSVDVSKRTVRDTMRTMADFDWLQKEVPNGTQWRRGPLLTGEKELMTDERENQSPKSVGEFDSVGELSEGEVYFGTVDKASSNALIWLDEPNGSHVNLGPIDKSVVGEEVRFRYLAGVWGRCLDEEYTYEGYDPQSDGSSSSSSSSSYSSKTSVNIPAAKSSGKGTITDNDPENKNKLLKGNL